MEDRDDAWQEVRDLYQALGKTVVDLDGYRFRVGNIADNAILLDSRTGVDNAVGIALTEAYGDRWLAIIIPIGDATGQVPLGGPNNGD